MRLPAFVRNWLPSRCKSCQAIMWRQGNHLRSIMAHSEATIAARERIAELRVAQEGWKDAPVASPWGPLIAGTRLEATIAPDAGDARHRIASPDAVAYVQEHMKDIDLPTRVYHADLDSPLDSP